MVNEKLFTPEELKDFNGRDESKGPYLAILGRVYNVKKGKKHYGPDGGYEFFSGKLTVLKLGLGFLLMHSIFCIRTDCLVILT